MKRIAFLVLLMLFPLLAEAKGKIIEAPSAEHPSIQLAIDGAKNGDEVRVESGKYLFDKPIMIKEKENFSLSAKGKVSLSNKNGAALIVENSNISIEGIIFFRNEIALECSDSIISVKGSKFQKNRIGIQGVGSVIISDKNVFDTNFLAAILLSGQDNNLKIVPSTSFRNNYADIYPYSVNSSSETLRPQGNKIFFGRLKD